MTDEPMKVPIGFTVRREWSFTFSPCEAFSNRTAEDGRPRWWVHHRGKTIGRITEYGPDNFVAYPDHEDSWEDFTGPASYCTSVKEACMSLAAKADVWESRAKEGIDD